MDNVMLLFAHLGDNELILKINSGHHSCFEVLVRNHSQALYRVGRSWGIDDVSTEDTIHNTHVEAFGSLKDYRLQHSYRRWLTRLMLKNCREKSNTVKNGYEYSEDFHPSVHGDVKDNADSASRYAYKTLSTSATTMLERLPLPERSCYVLHEIEGFTVKEVAEMLQLSTQVCQSHITRAKAQMQKPVSSRTHDVYPYHITKTDKLVSSIMYTIGKHALETRKTATR